MSFKVQILIDNPTSWIIPYAHELKSEILSLGHKCNIVHKHEEVTSGDVLCLLACEKVFNKLELNKYNLVVHESDLPKGKGWSPVTWQILEGKSNITMTLFEATNEVDSGVIYEQCQLKLKGNELLTEIKHLQGKLTNKLILGFLKNYNQITPRPQEGEPSFYKRRKPEDSELDINKSILEQFNLLRVCDNERYPAFFNINGEKYILKIFKA